MAKRNPLGATGLHDSSFDSVQVSILDRSCQERVVGVCGQSCHRRLSILLGLSGWQVLGFDWTALLPTDSIPQC